MGRRVYQTPGPWQKPVLEVPAMSTSTPPRPSVKPSRTARLQQVGAATVLWLTSGKLTTAYRLTTLDHGFGKAAFRLAKADQGDGSPEVYDVLLDGARSSCECKGFLRWHHCKHLESIEQLIAAGKIAVPPVEVPTAQPKQAAPWCEHCNDEPGVFCSHCAL